MPKNIEPLKADEIAFSIPEDLVRELRNRGVRGPIVGQDRAISALELGLGVRADGYNIFVMGASGTGRRTVLTALLADYKANPANLQDIAYVYNFQRPLEPRALFFPSGTGSYFRKTLQSAIESIRKQALQISRSESFAAARKRIVTAAEAEENRTLSEFEARMAAEGFKLIQLKEESSQSMDLVPLIKGKPVGFDELESRVSAGRLPQASLNSLRERYYHALDQMSELFASLRERRRATDKQVRALKQKSAEPIIDNEFAVLLSLCQKEVPNQTALKFLAEVKEDLLARVQSLCDPFKSPAHKKAFIGRYAVNLVADHQGADKPPVIQEEVPTFANLFGSIEPRDGNEDVTVNAHLRLRPGAVHRASGGFLVLRLQDLLLEEGAWPYLKRVLQSGKVEIQTPPTGNHAPSMIKPEALPARFKAIVIGGENSYDFLYQEDPDFQKLFKVCAEFDSVMERTEENMAKFVAFADEFTRKQGLLALDDAGLARVLSWGARVSEYRSMLTTRFTLVSDLITEADYQARLNGAGQIDAEAVRQALDRRRFLQRLPEEKFAEMVRSREILIEVDGSAVGRVNGLAVHDRGYHAFGIPVAVTAQAAPGDKGVINIERESGLSGEIYDKAHLIIQGLLHRTYARDIPLALSASICFEQSYTEVDGDSASCAEFFSLLSAIADIPLRQDVAITGSLNQLGDVQPVGGIPEKIDGFFDACHILGLTGKQGVIIPRRNLSNVVPSDRVQEAVERGTFHVWAIDTADEGIEILSGMPSAEFNRRVSETLAGYAAKMRRQGG